MPDTNLTAAQEPENTAVSYEGTIKISVVSSIGMVPVENATVTISDTADPDTILMTLTTDSSGQTPVMQLPRRLWPSPWNRRMRYGLIPNIISLSQRKGMSRCSYPVLKFSPMSFPCSLYR